MPIEWCMSDRGDRALYAFRHGNIHRLSMLLSFNRDATSHQIMVATFENYGHAVARVGEDWKRGRRALTGGEQTPMFNMPATPEEILKISLVDGLVNDTFTTDATSKSLLIGVFNHMINAESCATATDSRDPRLHLATPFSDYLQGIAHARKQQEQQLHEDEIAYAVERMEQLEQIRERVSSDWGTW